MVERRERTIGSRSRRHVLAAVLLLAAPCADAGSKRVVEKDDEGRVRARYWVDDEGRRDGEYVALHPGGRKRLRSHYEADLEHGWRESWDERGRDVDRVLVVRGVVAHPRSAEEVDAVLAELVPEKPARDLDAMRVQTLRWMKAYRYLCGVPYEDLILDDELNDKCQAAARLFEELGRWTHEPDDPGWPEEEFARAAEAARSSNVADWSAGLTPRRMVMDQFWDSNPENIGRVGHRHWILSPRMRRLGVGIRGDYGAVWVKDESRERWPIEWTAFPPPGFTPVDLVDYDKAVRQPYAWSVFLDAESFAPPRLEDLTVEVRPVNRRLDVGPPLELDSLAVHERNLLQLQHAVIFRPLGVRIRDEPRYLVSVTGLKDARGRPRPLRYVVEFFDRPSHD